MSPVFTHDEVLNQLRQIIAKSLAIDPESITEDSYLNELGAESLDLVDISFSCEDQFHILMPDKNIFEAGKTIFEEGVLLQEGFLTDEGKRFLKTRMPDFDTSANDGQISMADVNHALLRVGTWVRMIQGLLEVRPNVCTVCNIRLVNDKPDRMLCPTCKQEYEIPSGDALNQEWVRKYYETEYLPRHPANIPSEIAPECSSH